MKNTENTGIMKIPENYRKSQNIEDFNIGDVVYKLSRSNFVKGKVEAVTTHVHIKWDNCIYNLNYSIDQLEYLYVKDKPKFKVGDRVRSTDTNSVGLVGTINNITYDHIEVNWRSNKDKLSKGIYSKSYWYLLELIEGWLINVGLVIGILHLFLRV